MTHTRACDAARSFLATARNDVTAAYTQQFTAWGRVMSSATKLAALRSDESAALSHLGNARSNLHRTLTDGTSSNEVIGQWLRIRMDHARSLRVVRTERQDAESAYDQAATRFGAAFNDWSRFGRQHSAAQLTAWTVGRECGCIPITSTEGPWSL